MGSKQEHIVIIRLDAKAHQLFLKAVLIKLQLVYLLLIQIGQLALIINKPGWLMVQVRLVVLVEAQSQVKLVSAVFHFGKLVHGEIVLTVAKLEQ